MLLSSLIFLILPNAVTDCLAEMIFWVFLPSLAQNPDLIRW